MKRALITGITGQDGSYLAELLLSKGYEVHGLIRRTSTFPTQRIDHLYEDPHVPSAQLFLHYADLGDASSVQSIIGSHDFDEIYHLGAQSHVRISFDIPEYTADVTGTATVRLLEAVRKFQDRTGKTCKFYQASSSELFGSSPPPQNEATPFLPQSPYACAKAYGFHITRNYREAFGMFAVNGILFNHESERRGETFVTRKITRAVGRIRHGLQTKVFLGNLDAERDWGFAGDYVEAMWSMLQADRAEDFVVGTGESHSVREFLTMAFERAGLDWKEHVEFDRRYLRPSEVDALRADASKIHRKLGWKPKCGFAELVARMVDHDLELAARERRARGA
ncbi:MAG: GDP-mannose 4,6-dehydratase [Polyangiaceae bacterium]